MRETSCECLSHLGLESPGSRLQIDGDAPKRGPSTSTSWSDQIDSVTHLVSLTARGHAATTGQSKRCVFVLKLYSVSPAEPRCVCVALKPGMSIESMGSNRNSPSVGLNPRGVRHRNPFQELGLSASLHPSIPAPPP
ncbi:hypothetical protein KIL84_005830 [Mauremys mutica]|uniref:Uncharacterized protein n=1 Tax=Mauremys mutica TaxID=74926 RepID=A0A9D3XIP6_9SAUR|nr:hypothetical protein KIL84_005830 [Mauremys mutica]